ncbi:serine/threonine-protein kinase [Noviherbaspirillum saxi]|uniref:serine/threonine-protein kinase n=1 Tax=Noviherbaspirillum saxi TaxID=2320863 RepID=UPI001F2224D3|nr:serine/threonine-protein kinase [Noviherbaspirillum saxi]
MTRELGRGTAGCVYLAHDPVIARDIAVKTFTPRLGVAEKNRFERQFINEARAAGRLSHPHIVTIYDASSEGGTTYLAMEYLQGRELNRILESGHRYTPDQVASIAWKIADALHHAHSREVIHRDIKPSNIFIVKDDHPKLIDFGIARSPNRLAERDAPPDEPYTMIGNNRLLGTPNYMSPEQAAGKPVDSRTDIYSLGAVAYEMLTGRTPFQAERADKLLQQIAYKAVPRLTEIDARIPAALSHIVMKAMAKRPEKRYQTAEEMALDLKRYLLKERRARRRVRLELPSAAASGPEWIAQFGTLRLRAVAIGAATAVAVASSAYLFLR